MTLFLDGILLSDGEQNVTLLEFHAAIWDDDAVSAMPTETPASNCWHVPSSFWPGTSPSGRNHNDGEQTSSSSTTRNWREHMTWLWNSPIYTTPRATSTPQGWNWPDGSTRWRNWERMLSTLSLTPSTITMRRFSTSSSTGLPMPEQSPSMLKSRLSELSSEVLQTFHSSSSD